MNSTLAAATDNTPAWATTPPRVGGRGGGLQAESVKNFLLRTSSGDVYYVGDDGYRIPLFSGDEVMNCMAGKYLVWDQVSQFELDRFEPHPWSAAIGCGISFP